MKLLSDLEPKISWRLNDLLRAGQKAQAFAAVTWSSADDPTNKPFTQWHPNEIVTDDSQEHATSNLEQEGNADETEAIATVREEELIQAKQLAFDEGFEQGKAEAELKYSLARNTLDDLTKKIQQSQSDKTIFFDPLRRLSLHLAEQLVRGELSISSAIVDRLVKNALEDIEASGDDEIIINLNPIDAEDLQGHLDSDFTHLELRGDPKISQGNFSISIGDKAIDDFLENRLRDLAKELFKSRPQNQKTITNVITKGSDKDDLLEAKDDEHIETGISEDKSIDMSDNKIIERDQADERDGESESDV